MHGRKSAVTEGLASEPSFVKKYRERHENICSYLRSCRASALEAEFVFIPNMPVFLGNLFSALEYYAKYLQGLDAERDWNQRASALVHFCIWKAPENPGSAILHLNEASAIYAENNHEVGQLICQYQRIRFFQAKTHSPENCLEQMLSLAKRFLQIGHYSWYYNSSLYALRIIVNDTSILDRFASVKEAMSEQLTKVQDYFHLRFLDVWEMFDQGRYTLSAEIARIRLESYLLEHYHNLTPFWISDIYHALYKSYTALADHDMACKYAEINFTHTMELEQFTTQKRSVARHTLTQSRVAVLTAKLSSVRKALRASGSRFVQERSECLRMVAKEIQELEHWDQVDTKEGHLELLQKKSILLKELSSILNEHFPDEVADGRATLPHHTFTSRATVPEPFNDLGALLRLHHEGRAQEGLQLAKLQLDNMLRNPAATIEQQSDAYYVCALAYDIASWKNALSVQEKEANLEYQFDYLRKQRDLCKSIGDKSGLIRSALPFSNVLYKYIQLHPKLKPLLLVEMEDFFLEAEKGSDTYRRSLLRDQGITTLLRMQKYVSGFLVGNLYYQAASFYLRMLDAPSAWTWVQKGRARALFEILSRHKSSSNTLLSTLEKNPSLHGLLAEESDLAKQIQTSTADKYFEATASLAKHREKLKSVPVLNEFLGTTGFEESFSFQQAGDIYSAVKDWLPNGTNVVLVNWFIDIQGWICLLTMDSRSKIVNGRARLTLQFPKIREWMEEYLVSPLDEMKPLERKHSALKELAVLVEALEWMSKPEDLLILSPPGPFASIPLHGIPINGVPMIERNPVIYTSSFSLYREAISRVQRPGSPQTLSLASATFAAAYEEEGHEDEREQVFDTVKQLATDFYACHILGHNLTKDTFAAELQSSPWIHYHGHAYYETSDALNQCYVLSDGIEHSDPPTTSDKDIPGGDEPEDHVTQQISEIPTRSHLLSTLMSNSSSLSVSDIFTMILTATHPFICSIACDSGVQDIPKATNRLDLSLRSSAPVPLRSLVHFGRSRARREGHSQGTFMGF
jgi:hypothetical protein